MRPYVLSADKSPMENLWDCIDYCCRSILRCKKLLITSEEKDDLMMDWKIRSFIRFKNRVLSGNYDRNYPLWKNVFYCCWGTWTNTWRPAKRNIINKINTVSADEPLQIQSDCSEHEGFARIDMYANDLSNKLNYRHDYNDSTVRHEQLIIPEQRDNAYELYLEECYDLGVTPVDMETYVVRNGGKIEWADPNRTYQDYRNEITREKRAKKRASSKRCYDKHKDDPEYKEHRKQLRREAAKRRYDRLKTDPEYMAHVREIHRRSYRKCHSKSSSDSTSSGSTGIPSIE